MKVQIGSSEYTCEQVKSLSRSDGQFAGLTELSISIELDWGQDLPTPVKLIACVLSHDTGTPIKFFSGWFFGEQKAEPKQNGEKILFTLKTTGILIYLDKGKPISNFKTNGTLEGVAINLAKEAGLTKDPGELKYLLISAEGENPETSYFTDSKIENYATVLNNLAANLGYEVHVQELGWMDIPALLSTTGAITGLKLLPIGSTENACPVPTAIYDPTDPTNCDTFPFRNFWFKRTNPTITSVEFHGAFAEFALDIEETPQTSYSKYLVFPVPAPVDNPNITDPEISFPLPAQIRKVHQVLLLPSPGQLEIIEPYDPETPLEAGFFYFDPKGPRVILSNADIAALEDPTSCLVFVNFQFVKARVTDTAASNNLSDASGGALEKAYIVISDQSVNDFAVATESATNLLASYLNEGFGCGGDRSSTTENWLVGQSMTIQIPAYSINKVVKVTNAPANYKGKIDVLGTMRDEVEFKLTFAEVVNPKGKGFAAAARTGASRSNQPNLPTYEHIPFDPEGTACNIAVTVSGSNYTAYNTYDESDYSLPADLTEDEGTLEFSATEANLVYSGSVDMVKANSSLSFYLSGQWGDVDASLVVTVNSVEIYNKIITSDIANITNIISLADYLNQDIEVEATVNIPAQSGTCVDLYGLICPSTKIQQLWLDANCCNITTVVGTNTQGLDDDGKEPIDTDLNHPHDVKILSTGNLIICDTSNDFSVGTRIRKITNDNIVETIGGGGANDPPVDSVPATENFLGQVYYIWVHNDEIYLAAFQYNQVAKIDTNGDYIIVYESATPNTLLGVCVDSTGQVYVSDPFANVVYKVIDSTTVEIYAGILGDDGYSGDDGLATSAAIGEPIQIAVDENDNLYICDSNSGAVRKVDAATQIITTFAGNGSTKSFGSPAVGFETFIFGLSFLDNIAYLADTRYVFKVEDSLLDKYAGMGVSIGGGFDGDNGSPLTAKLNNFGVYGGNLLKTADALYIADPDNYVIRKVSCAPKPTPTGDSCLLMTWTASGVLSEINSSSSTGKGFEIDVAALSASATGEFICNLEIPEGYFHYRLRHTIRYNVTTDPGSDLTLGHLRVYINDNLAISYALSFGDGAADELNSTGIADLTGFDLTQYIGQTIEIKYSYDNSTYNPSSGVASGYYEVSPIRVCYKRIDLQTIMGSEIAYDAKYQLRLFNDPLGSPSNNISSDSKTMVLKNPDTQLGEFFLLNMAKGILGTTDGLRILANDNLLGEFTSGDFEALDTQVKVLFLDESLYGQTVEFTAELTSTDYNSFYEITLVFG